MLAELLSNNHKFVIPDDWLAHSQERGTNFLYLVLRKLGKTYETGFFNSFQNIYSKGSEFTTYEEALLSFCKIRHWYMTKGIGFNHIIQEEELCQNT